MPLAHAGPTLPGSPLRLGSEGDSKNRRGNTGLCVLSPKLECRFRHLGKPLSVKSLRRKRSGLACTRINAPLLTNGCNFSDFGPGEGCQLGPAALRHPGLALRGGLPRASAPHPHPRLARTSGSWRSPFSMRCLLLHSISHLGSRVPSHREAPASHVSGPRRWICPSLPLLLIHGPREVATHGFPGDYDF